VISKLTRALGYLGTLAAAVTGGILQVATRSNAPRVSATGALAAVNASVVLAVDGMSAAVVQLSGTWAGTVAWSGSVDGGTTWFPVNLIPYGGGLQVASATANGQWEFACGGLTHLRAQMTAFTSGSATALVAAASGVKSVRVGAPSGNPVPVYDGNNQPYTTAAGLSANTPFTAGRAIGMACTAAGTLTLTLAGGGTINLPVYAGWQTFPFSATQVSLSAGANGSVFNLN
jgi:hypothetical protein